MLGSAIEGLLGRPYDFVDISRAQASKWEGDSLEGLLVVLLIGLLSGQDVAVDFGDMNDADYIKALRGVHRLGECIWSHFI